MSTVCKRPCIFLPWIPGRFLLSCWDQYCTDHRILCLQTPTSWSRHTVISQTFSRLLKDSGHGPWLNRLQQALPFTSSVRSDADHVVVLCHMFSPGRNCIQFLSQSIPLQASQQKNSSTSSTHFNKKKTIRSSIFICPPPPLSLLSPQKKSTVSQTHRDGGFPGLGWQKCEANRFRWEIPDGTLVGSHRFCRIPGSYIILDRCLDMMVFGRLHQGFVSDVAV